MDNRQNRIRFLEKSLDKNPDEPFTNYALAMEYKSLDPGRSIDLLSALLEKAPEYLPTYYTLAQLLLDSDQVEKAKAILGSGRSHAMNQQDHKTLSEINDLLSNLEFED